MMFQEEIAKSYIARKKWKVISRWRSRICYEIKNEPTLVFKKAKNLNGILKNLVERSISSNFDMSWVKQKIAKILSVSWDGVWVIQEKCDPVAEMPEEIFGWWAFDCQKENFWLLNWELVKLDYGNTDLLYNSLVSNKKVSYNYFSYLQE